VDPAAPPRSDDRVSGLALSPDGSHVYVAGTAHQAGNVWSFMTLVYEG
jgi:hypothetical protein